MATQEQKAKALATKLGVEVTYEAADDHIEVWSLDAHLRLDDECHTEFIKREDWGGKRRSDAGMWREVNEYLGQLTQCPETCICWTEAPVAEAEEAPAEETPAEETVVVGDRVESATPDINGTVSTGTVVAVTDTTIAVRVDEAEVSTTPLSHKAWRKLPEAPAAEETPAEETPAEEVVAVATVPGTEATVTIIKRPYGYGSGNLTAYITTRTEGRVEGTLAFPGTYPLLDVQEDRARDTANRLWSEANEAAKAVWRELHPEAPEAPAAGRYAVEMDGQLRFFHVDRPTEGRWAGYVFVSQQAGDDLYPVKGHARARVLLAISVDPAAASRRYGRELGVCGVCGRTLTDPESRAAGIGPVCAGRF